jgi:hypothetical protein
MSDVVYSEMLAVRVADVHMKKLRSIERATRRSRSEIVRLLIEAALFDGRPDVWLDSARLEGRGGGR